LIGKSKKKKKTKPITMSITSWTSKSRYGSLRSFSYDSEKEQIRIQCEDVSYFSFSTKKSLDHPPVDDMVSIDPDGGPYLGVKGTLFQEGSNTAYRILRILSHTHDVKKKVLVVVLSVCRNPA